MFWPIPSPTSPLPLIVANTLPVLSENSYQSICVTDVNTYGVTLPPSADSPSLAAPSKRTSPNVGRVRSEKHRATTARVKHPKEKRRRATEGKRGEEGGNERKRQKMEIVAWEVEDGSVVRVETVYRMEADLILDDPNTYLGIRSHRPQIDKEDRVYTFFFFFVWTFQFPACPKFPTRPRLLSGRIYFPFRVEIVQDQLRTIYLKMASLRSWIDL
jgi:hypothetical protein